MNPLLDWARQAGPTLVLAEARSRVERGQAGNTGLRVDLTQQQRLQVSELLGLDWMASGRPITLARLRKALAEYELSLEWLLEALDGPLIDRVAQRAAARTAQQDEAQAARDVLAAVVAPSQLDDVIASCLPARSPLPRARRLARVAAALPSAGSVPPTPIPDVLLPVLAAQCFEDAHALDRSRSLGQAAARMCLILAGQPVPAGSLLAEQWRAAWAGVGIACDRVSSMVLTLNLPLSGSPAVRAITGTSGEPVWLTARLLEQATPPPTPLPEVYVCENPSVLETAADRLGGRCAPWRAPSAAHPKPPTCWSGCSPRLAPGSGYAPTTTRPAGVSSGPCSRPRRRRSCGDTGRAPPPTRNSSWTVCSSTWDPARPDDGLPTGAGCRGLDVGPTDMRVRAHVPAGRTHVDWGTLRRTVELQAKDSDMMRRRVMVAVITVAGLPLWLGGCLVARERVCEPGNYPVVEHDGRGGTCVPDGQAPPPGYREYPAGATPTYLDESYQPTFTDSPTTPAPSIPVPGPQGDAPADESASAAPESASTP